MRGFTLVELVVALAISGIVVLTVVLAVGVASDAAARNADLQESARQDRNARMLLTTILRSARVAPSRDGGFVGLDAAEAPSGGDELAFTSIPGVALGGQRPGEPLTVRLWRSNDGIVAGLAPLERGGSVGVIDTLLLFPGADAMEIRYLDPVQAEWLDAWELSDRLPGAIAIGFGRDRPLPALVLHLRARPADETDTPPAVGDQVGGS
jgi:prepilin-type N-terminal cleavage/methylation domain-containing protein